MRNKMEKIDKREIFIQPEALRALEGMPELIVQSKIVILAVVLDIKPASLVETDLVQPGQVSLVQERMKKLFDDLKLVYNEDGADYQNEPLVSLHYSVAKSSESLEKVRDAQNRMNDINEYHEALGKAVGIPDSAVKGYVSGE